MQAREKRGRMKKQWFAGLLVGLACVCGAQQGSVGSGAAPGAPTPAAGMAKATPAIWRVKGTHGTVYLFGSVHVMKPDVEWEAGKVKAAFDSADVLYLEIANLDDTSAAQPLLMQYGLDPQHPLSEKISKEDLTTLDTVVKAIGMPGETMMEPMRPWL